MPNFDPYLEWFGIQSTTKPTYYQLLGVTPQDATVENVRRCAKSRIRMLQKLDVGQHEAIRDELLQRIRRAAKCLSSDESRTRYNQKLAAQQNATGEKPATSVAPPIQETASPIVVTSKSTDKTKFAASIKAQRSGNRRLALLGTFGVLSLLGVVYLVVTQTGLGSQLAGLAQPPAKVDRLPREVGSAEFPFADPDDLDSADANTNDEPKVDEQPVELPDDDEAMDDPDMSDPAEPGEPEVPVVSHDDLKKLGGLLNTARDALKARDTQRAFDLLTEAKPLLIRPADVELHARLSSVTECVQQYWMAAIDGLGQLRAGAEFSLDGELAICVEKTPDTVIVRSAGKNSRFPVENLPPRFQIAMAERWLDDNASSTKMIRSAMMAFTPGFSSEEARSLWRNSASAADFDPDLLDLVLDDDYQLAP